MDMTIENKVLRIGVLSSRAIGRTHAVTSIHVVTLALAVGNGNGGQRPWKNWSN
jgi:hypothetical protein